MFQSLIGTIKTLIFLSNSPFKYLFQSLIGTIKTIGNATLSDDYIMFQSLIGTIKTIHDEYVFVANETVSIPYRDDKNSISINLFFIEVVGFNPL